MFGLALTQRKRILVDIEPKFTELRRLIRSGLWLAPLVAMPSAFAAPKLAPSASAPPSAAIHVAPNGNDRAVGTRERPLRTVAAALEHASAGGTVVLHEGTYREALAALHKRVTLQPAPGAEVWLKGSRVVSSWTRDGKHWRHDGWTARFCEDCHDPGNVDPTYPLSGLPDQVFLDGQPLRQVAGLEALAPGTFRVDRAGERLLLGSDPTGRLVEASVHSTALTIGSGGEGTRVRGLGFAHYAPTAEPGLGGAVRGDAADLVFEGNTFAFSAVKGLSIFKPGAVVRNNTFHENGMMGLEAWQADGLVVSGNRFTGNNREGFAQTGTVSEAAGAKITKTVGVSVTGNVFRNNRSNGLWLDIGVRDVRAVENRVEGNARHGIFFEWSADGLIASNTVVGNGVSGIAIADAAGVAVRNNTLQGNGVALILQRDGRAVPSAEDGPAGAVFAGNRVEGRAADLGAGLYWKIGRGRASRIVRRQQLLARAGRGAAR